MSGPYVLVVEDDPSVRGLLETLLVDEGYSVATAADGSSGLGLAAQRRPDLVLLDLMMPDLGGRRVLEELRGDPGLSGVPVIIVSGQLDAIPALAEEIGEASVFAKPFSVTSLLAQVATVTGGPTMTAGSV